MNAPSLSFAPDLFAGQTIFVTGGTSGIGAETARLFHSLGANVVAAGLAAHAAPLVEDDRLEMRELDVTDETALAHAVTVLPRLDHLVLCAGISLNDAEYELASFRRVLEVNLVAGMNAAMLAAPLLRQRAGSVVMTGSMYGFFGGGERPAYSASKGGVAQLTKSLAMFFAGDAVRVNAVAPGWIETPLARNLDPETKDGIKARIPMARWGEGGEIATVIAFLCSPAASYITGAIIPADGGYLVA